MIARTANPLEHRQILRELRYLNSCSSPNIVRHFGSFLSDHDTQICILMEFCEAGSLDSLMQRMIDRGARSSEHVLGRIASAVSQTSQESQADNAGLAWSRLHA